MTAFRGVALALLKGFVRDRASLFFSIVFPLMFLVLFGAIFDRNTSPQLTMVVVGQVPLIDELPAEERAALERSFEISRTGDRDEALADVRANDASVAVEMDGDTLVAHYSNQDQQRAPMVVGTLASFVDGANLAASGVEPRFSFRPEQVEDESLETIQYVTPGLLGWAVAMSAAFGAAATLQGWRQSKLLRRLQLSPAPAAVTVSARVVVTMVIALVQMAIFLGLGRLAFGLQLTGAWWASIPLLVTGTLSFMALGLLAGAVAKTQEGAVNMSNFVVLPMAFLSGSFFSLDDAPGWLQGISRAMPLWHLNDGMFDVLVGGEGAASVLPPMAFLVAFGLVVGGVAAMVYRRAEA